MRIPLQPCDIASVSAHSMIPSVVQYFPVSILAKRLSGWWRILQLSLARYASLKLWMSRKSKPPLSFGMIIFSQDIQAIFLLPLRSSHHKWVRADWILWHRDSGSLKLVRAWDGIGESTLWSIVVFPAVDRNLLDQPFSFCLIFSTIELNMSLFLLLKCSGSPRYLPTPPSFVMLSFAFTACFRVPSVLFEKVIDDLSTLIYCPEAFSYRVRSAWSDALLSCEAFTKNMVSSANKKWLSRGLPRATLIPFKEPSSCALLQRPDRTSLHIIKMYGERGSPWRIPLVGLTLPLGELLMRKEYETEDTHCMIRFTHVGWKPNRWNTCWMKSHSSRSYALLISVLTAIAHLFSALEIFRKWRTSCVINT